MAILRRITTLLVDKHNIDAYYVELEQMDKDMDNEMESFIPSGLIDYAFTDDNTPFKELITKNKDNKWYIIKNKDDVVGYIIIRCVPEENVINLCSLYIKPEHRRKGYAKKVIKELPKGTTVTVNVYTNNEPAKTLYEKLGFKSWTQNMYIEL